MDGWVDGCANLFLLEILWTYSSKTKENQQMESQNYCYINWFQVLLLVYIYGNMLFIMMKSIKYFFNPRKHTYFSM
jgi:hypothetical protein